MIRQLAESNLNKKKIYIIDHITSLLMKEPTSQLFADRFSASWRIAMTIIGAVTAREERPKQSLS
jgi:hypothetical protein